MNFNLDAFIFTPVWLGHKSVEPKKFLMIAKAIFKALRFKNYKKSNYLNM